MSIQTLTIFLKEGICDVQEAHSGAASCYIVDGTMLYFVTSHEDVVFASTELSDLVQITMDEDMLVEDPILGVYWIGAEDLFGNIIEVSINEGSAPTEIIHRQVAYKYLIWIALSAGGIVGLAIWFAVGRRKQEDLEEKSNLDSQQGEDLVYESDLDNSGNKFSLPALCPTEDTGDTFFGACKEKKESMVDVDLH